MGGIDPFIFKVLLVVVLMIAQAALWIWVGLRRRQQLQGMQDNWAPPATFYDDQNQYSDRRQWPVGR